MTLQASAMGGDNSNPIAAAWARAAQKLSTWAMDRLVNRTDVWGLYVRWTGESGAEHTSMTAPAKKHRGMECLTLLGLERHFQGLVGHVKGVHSTSAANTCKWFGFDFDNHDHDPEKVTSNFEQAMSLVDHLREYGFEAILEDSNGDGGLHVWALLNAPAPSTTVYMFVQHVMTELGISAEGFPKQAEIGVDGFGNFLRIPGKHHSREHWSRIYQGGRWLEGQEAVDALLNGPINDVELLPAPPTVEESEQTVTINRELSEPSRPGRRSDTEIALDCLGHLGNDVADDRDLWIKVGQILHDIDASLLSEWDNWSQQSAKHKHGECADKWKGFGRKQGKVVTLGTLVYLAKRAGAAIQFYDRSHGGSLAATTPTSITKPQVVLPGGGTSIIEAASQLGQLLAKSGRYFARGGAVVTLDVDDTGEVILRPVKNATLPSAFEQVAALVKPGDEGKLDPATCSEQCAKIIAASDVFMSALPPLKLLSPCPVLIERDGQLVEITGYDRASGIYAMGAPVEVVPLEQARELLEKILADFRFATPPDQSRAMAAMITPALVFGGILGGRSPVDLGEADASQSGKGYRNRLTAAIYRVLVHTVTQKKGGVGSLEESFNAKLIRGANFI